MRASPAALSLAAIVLAGVACGAELRIQLRDERGRPIAARLDLRNIAEHGLECRRITRDMELTERTPALIEIRLWPRIRMRNRGWWSGNMHIHRPMEDTPIHLEAEDLHLGVVGDRPLPRESIHKTSPDRRMTVANAEDERGGGAWMLHGLSTAPGLDKVLRDGERTTDSGDPPGIEFVRAARSRKAGLFPWFDLEKPIWWEALVMMALELPDSMDLGTGRFVGLHGYSDYSMHLMYWHWNLGWMVPPSAGAASGVLPNPVGYNRVYVKLDGDFTVEKWYGALRAGRVMVSNGPLVFLRAEVATARWAPAWTRIEAISSDNLGRVELVANEKVIQSWRPAGGSGSRLREKRPDGAARPHQPIFVDGHLEPPRRRAILPRMDRRVATKPENAAREQSGALLCAGAQGISEMEK